MENVMNEQNIFHHKVMLKSYFKTKEKKKFFHK